MSKQLERPILVIYWYAKNCPWSRQRRWQICRTLAEIQELRQLCIIKPNQFEIEEERELPC